MGQVKNMLSDTLERDPILNDLYSEGMITEEDLIAMINEQED